MYKYAFAQILPKLFDSSLYLLRPTPILTRLMPDQAQLDYTSAGYNQLSSEKL